MGQPKESKVGYSPSTPEGPKREFSKNSADHSAKEQLAIAFINRGKLQEAESIYKDLIKRGTKNHIVYANLAAIYTMQGKSNGLISLLEKALQLQPNSPETHNSLGVALISNGNVKAAVSSYKMALQLKPNYPEAHNNLGNALREQGDLDTAISSYDTALRLKPNYPEAHHNLGVSYAEQGDLNAAITCYKAALRLKPNYPEAHNNLGIALKEQGFLDAAINSFKTALQIRPNYPEAHNNLGIAFKEQGNLDAAVTSYNHALQLKTNYQEAQNNLGNALKELGDLDAAITCYKTALQIQPNHPDTHNNLGLTFHKQGHLVAAIASFNTAIKLNGNNPSFHTNLGVVFQAQGDLAEAISSYKKAIKLKASHPEAHNNLGAALKEQGDLDAAIASFKRALELKPIYPEAYKNLAMAELLLGDYEVGLTRYEYRFQCEQGLRILSAIPSSQQWRGEKLIKGSKLLLVSEQGLGDTIQFMRYAKALRSEGISVSVCAHPKLHGLIKTSDVDPSPLTPEQADQFNEGLWVPLLSVPRYLKITKSNPIIKEPYIKTTEELSTKWQEILSTEQLPIIGINWQGNPSHEKTNSKGRSLPLQSFAPIVQNSNLTLLSLQKGFGSEQLDTCAFRNRFVSCQDQINETWDFLETAAIIANCDLVITSDTSVAHLAGGMGKTTWLLLKKVPEWRWGLEGDQSFWYPSMRLFRQRERNNWDELLQRVAEALEKQFGGAIAANPATSNANKISNQP